MNRGLWIGVALSAVAHVLVASGAQMLDGRPAVVAAEAAEIEVDVEIIDVPEGKEPDPEPEQPEPEQPTAEDREPEPEHRAPPTDDREPEPEHRQPTTETPQPPTDVAPSDEPSGGESTEAADFGFTLESSSRAGDGPAVPHGSTLKAPPRARGGRAKHVDSLPASGKGDGTGSGPVIEAPAASKMPLPRGRCTGTYTDAAREAGIEGTVLLDLVVGANGRARDIMVVRGLDHGLSQAAIAAARACRFSPGQRDGHAVAVRVRSFKIRFLLRDAP